MIYIIEQIEAYVVVGGQVSCQVGYPSEVGYATSIRPCVTVGAPYDGIPSSSMSYPWNPSSASSNRTIRSGQKDGSPQLHQIRQTSSSSSHLHTVQAMGSSVTFFSTSDDK
ncbi:hypothetical protein ACLOJK_018618 [Asimina triloba]